MFEGSRNLLCFLLHPLWAGLFGAIGYDIRCGGQSGTADGIDACDTHAARLPAVLEWRACCGTFNRVFKAHRDKPSHQTRRPSKVGAVPQSEPLTISRFQGQTEVHEGEVFAGAQALGGFPHASQEFGGRRGIQSWANPHVHSMGSVFWIYIPLAASTLDGPSRTATLAWPRMEHNGINRDQFCLCNWKSLRRPQRFLQS